MTPAGERLAGSVRAVREHLARRALVAAGFWLGALTGVVLLAAWLLAGPEGWRQGSRAPLVLDGLLLLAAAVLAEGVRRGVRGWLAEAAVARALEESAGLRPGLIQGALELSRSLPVGVSPALADRATAEAAAAVEAPVPRLVGALGSVAKRWARRGAFALGTLGLVLLLLLALAPARTGRAWVGLSAPLRVLAAPVLAPISVSPGSVEVPRGSDVEVRVEAPGRASVELAWQAAGDVATTEELTLADGVGMKTFRSLSATVQYRARAADGASTPTYRLVPVDPLFVSELRIEVVYPPHTGLPPEEHRGAVPPLRLPQGTRLFLEGRSSRPLTEASLVDSAGVAAVELSREQARFEGTWRPTRSGRYAWRFLDADGGQAAVQPDPLDISVVADSAPSVSIPIPGRDTLLGLSLRQPLILEAHDDYGLRRLELVAYRVTALGEAREPLVQGLDLGGTRAALARPLLDLSGWDLLPGDQVRYFALAVDNAPEAHAARSREFVLRVPDASEMRRDAERQLGDAADKLQELSAEAERRAEETRDAQRRAAAARPEDPERPGVPNARGEMGFEEKEQLRKAFEGQEELAGEVDSLRAELEALQKALEDAGQADPELRKELEELQELLAQIAGEQLRERLEEMSKGLDEQSLREASASLEELAKEQQSFRERLEQSLEQFRRAAVNQDFRATRAEMDELARNERALADALKEADKPELRVQQQEALEKDAAELESRMERLQERLRQLEEAGAERGVDAARLEAREGRERMTEARAEASRGQNRPAGERADRAADRLEQAAEKLDDAQRQMATEQARAAQEALVRAGDEALSLARRQSELRAAMESAPPESLPDLRGDEASLVQGVRNLAENLQAAAEGVLAGSPQISVQMGRAMESIERTIEALESRRPGGPAPAPAANQAVDDLNQLALMAMAGAEQMSGQQGEGQTGQESSEQLEQLAQQQGEMVNQTGQLTPLQLGAQALMEQLRRLAEEQQEVADELDELSKQEKAEEESLADLGALAGEAEALAKALAEGRLTPETLERQERLFHRLLDAGRSLEKEEEDLSDERESKSPGAFERGDVVPLGADKLGALRYGLPGAAELQRLPPAVRQLVLQYFERLNRGGGGAR